MGGVSGQSLAQWLICHMMFITSLHREIVKLRGKDVSREIIS